MNQVEEDLRILEAGSCRTRAINRTELKRSMPNQGFEATTNDDNLKNIGEEFLDCNS